MAKDPYPTRAELDALVLHMYKAGISYFEALREFKKQFVLTVLRDLDWNETKAARALRMHRNTLARTLSQLDLEIRSLRKTKRVPCVAWIRQGRRNSPAKQRRTGGVALDRKRCKRAHLFHRKNHNLPRHSWPERNVERTLGTFRQE